MAEMKFKFTIQPYQTEAVDSVVGVFAGQPFNDHFTYRRDLEIKRDVTNWMLSDEELYMGCSRNFPRQANWMLSGGCWVILWKLPMSMPGAGENAENGGRCLCASPRWTALL